MCTAQRLMLSVDTASSWLDTGTHMSVHVLVRPILPVSKGGHEAGSPISYKKLLHLSTGRITYNWSGL
eukprot:scaffold33176_cov23-Tisochrysis_lutea.AAC.1